jgi:hypothetical protein
LDKAEPNAPAQDEYDLTWVDQPAKAAPKLIVKGHLPRDYPRLGVRLLPGNALGIAPIAFSSSQGVSLVSLPDGKLLRFWELAGLQGPPYVVAAPHGEALVAVADASLYYIPLEH